MDKKGDFCLTVEEQKLIEFMRENNISAEDVVCSLVIVGLEKLEEVRNDIEFKMFGSFLRDENVVSELKEKRDELEKGLLKTYFFNHLLRNIEGDNFKKQ